MAHHNNSIALNTTELVSPATAALPKTTSTSVCNKNANFTNDVPDTDQIFFYPKHDESKHKITSTEKRLQYQTAIRNWYREFDAADDNLADSDDIQSLITFRTRIVSALDELQLASFNLAEVANVPEPILRFENETRQLRHSFNERIKSLKGLSCSDGSNVSETESQKSKATSYGSQPAQIEAAVKAAEYEVQLRLHDDEQRYTAALMQQKAALLKQEAELSKFQLQKHLQIERAKLRAIKEEQSDHCMPPDLCDEQDSQQKKGSAIP